MAGLVAGAPAGEVLAAKVGEVGEDMGSTLWHELWFMQVSGKAGYPGS